MREPTRLPVFLRAWRSGSKVCAIIIAILTLAGSALAKIGETREQVLRRENGRRQEIVAFRDEQLAGKPALMVDYKDGSTIGHVFGVNGREIVTLFDPNRPLLNEDITMWQGVFPTTWRVLERDGSSVTWISKGNLEMLATRKGIFICDRNKEAEVKAFQAKILSEEPAQVPAAKPAASPEDNDCLIVATQMHARLRGSAHWSRIAAFGVIDGQEKYGHAAVFYQPTSDSNVFMFDKNWGSLDLHTQSHDLNELIIAVNQSKTIQKLNIRAQMPRWIGGEAESEIREAKPITPIAPAETEAWARSHPASKAEYRVILAKGVITVADANSGTVLGKTTLEKWGLVAPNQDKLRHAALDVTAAVVAGNGGREHTVAPDQPVYTLLEYQRGKASYVTVTQEHGVTFVLLSDTHTNGRYEALISRVVSS